MNEEMISDHLKRASEYFFAAVDAIDAGDLISAERNLLEAYTLAPTRPSILVNLSIVYGRLNELEKAVHFAQAAIASDPKHLPAWLQLAAIQIERHDYDSALTQATHAQNVDPLSAEAHNLIGNIYRLTGKFEPASKHYHEAIRINDREASAYAGLGMINLYQSKIANAANDFRTALRMDPANRLAINGISLLPTGFMPSATYDHYLDTLDTLEPDGDPANHMFLKARLLGHLSRLQEAFTCFVEGNQIRASKFPKDEIEAWQKSTLYKLQDIINWKSDRLRYESEIVDKVLFIFGPSRSGKTTVEDLLARNRIVESSYEGGRAFIIENELRDLASTKPTGGSNDHANGLDRVKAELFASRISAGTGPNTVYISNTNPFLISISHLLYDLIPNSKFIFVTRDLQDNAAEIFIQDYAEKSIFAYDPDLIEFYLNHYHDMARILKSKMADRAMTIDYNDVCTAPARALDSISQFLDLHEIGPPETNDGDQMIRSSRSLYRDLFSTWRASSTDGLKR